MKIRIHVTFSFVVIRYAENFKLYSLKVFRLFGPKGAMFYTIFTTK